MEEDGTLVRKDDPKSSESCRLYFKGLIKKETATVLAGYEVAICDKDNKLLCQMKGSLHDSATTVLEAELMALRRGLIEAVRLGITHISVYCDYQTIFELVSFFFLAVEGFTCLYVNIVIYIYLFSIL